MTIYQYSLVVEPELASDSDSLIDKIVATISSDLKKNMGLICHRGFMAWGRKEMTTVLTCKAQFTKQGTKHSFEVLVKPIKSLGLENFMTQNIDNLPAISQVLNINAKEQLRKNKLVELYPGSYFKNTPNNIFEAQGNLSVWRGFDLTIPVYNQKLYIQIDPCSRVLKD